MDFPNIWVKYRPNAFLVCLYNYHWLDMAIDANMTYVSVILRKRTQTLNTSKYIMYLALS